MATFSALFGKKIIPPILDLVANDVAESTKEKKNRKRDLEDAPKVPAVMIDETKRKRKKKKSVVIKNLKRATSLAVDPDFAGHGLKVVEESLWCSVCGKNIKFVEKADVRQHVEGKRGQSGKTKKQTKHANNLAAAEKKEKEKEKMKQVIGEQRDKMFAESDQMFLPQGNTLLPDQLAMRAHVLRVLYSVGIKAKKLLNPEFLKLIEDPHPGLGGLNGVIAMNNVVAEMEKEKVVEVLQGQAVSVVFDASKVNFGVEACVARIVDAKEDITHICVGISAVPKNVSASSMIVLLRKHLAAAEVKVSDVVAAISDSGPPNPSAMELWNTTATELYDGQQREDEKLMWIACIMHAFSNCGLKLRKQLPLVKHFMSGFKRMVNTSDSSRKLWNNVCGSPCPGLAEKSFWAWWDCGKKIVNVWEFVPQFLAQAAARKLAEKSVAKMMETMKNMHELRAELDFALAFGKLFHDAGFELESDGFCLPFVQQHLSAVMQLLHSIKTDRSNAPVIQNVCASARQNGLAGQRLVDLPERLLRVADLVDRQFDMAIMQKMKEKLPLFRSASFFQPRRLAIEEKRPEYAARLRAMRELCVGLKGVRGKVSLEELEIENVTFCRVMRDRLAEVNQNPALDSPIQLWAFWKSQRLILPNHYKVVRILVLIQPSSALVERLFSLIKANTVGQQNNESAVTLQTRAMCLFNVHG